MKKVLGLILLVSSELCWGQSFDGFDSTTLAPVSDTPGDWGLKIIVFDVGQGDAIMVLAANGDVVLIDSGRRLDHGNTIANYLSTSGQNGIGNLETIDLLYTTHYDRDHIAGIRRIVESGIQIRKAYDQGLSAGRSLRSPTNRATAYSHYVTAVGDPNNNYLQDDDEPNFVRHRADFGQVEKIGLNDTVKIEVLSVRGDTAGANNDLNLDPSTSAINENPGSIALLVSLGEFEFYTAGDQTDNDWKTEPAAEEALVNANAITGGSDIDVIKVSHHGSDTSSADDFVNALDPEVALISTDLGQHGLPKRVAIQQYNENRGYVLITGVGLDSNGRYTDSNHNADDNFVVSDEATFDEQGRITVLVSPDGARYTVRGATFDRTFSSVDTDNVRN